MTNEIDILVRSILDSSGFKQTEQSIANLGKTITSSSKVSGFKDINSQITDIQTNIKQTQKLAESGFVFNSKDGSLRNTKGRFVAKADAASKMLQTEATKKLVAKQKAQLDIQKKLDDNIRRKLSPSMFKNFKEGAKLGTDFSQKLQFGLRGVANNFDFAALSALFFGMQLQRIFTGISKTTLGVYQDIMLGTSAASAGLYNLQVGWQTLEFVIGQAIANALLPLLPILMDMLNSFIDFVDQNPKIVAAVVGIGAALGTALLLFGSLKLGLSGFAGVVANFIGAMRSIGLFLSGDFAKALGLTKAQFADFKSGLMGLAKGLSLAIGVAVAVDFIVDAWKILNSNGSTLGEYGSLIGKAALAGALIGFFFGPEGALVGAAIGAAAGVVAVGLDIAFEVKDSITTLKDAGKLKDGLAKALQAAVPNSFVEWLGDSLTMGLTYFVRLKQNLQVQADDVTNASQTAGKQTFINNIGGPDAALKKAIDDAKKIKDLNEQLNASTSLGQKNDLRTQIAGLSAEIDNIIVAAGAFGQKFQTTRADVDAVAQSSLDAAAAAKSLADQTTQATAQFSSFDDVMKNNTISAADFIKTIDPTKIQDLSDALAKFQKDVGAMDFTKVTEIARTFLSLENALATTTDSSGKQKEGVNQLFMDLVTIIGGQGTGLIGALETFNGKMYELRTTIQDVFLKQITSVGTEMQKVATATGDAAAAQERYNRAVKGATG